MKKIVCLLLAIVVLLQSFSQVYYLTPVTVVDVIKRKTLPGMTVVITDSIISAVRPAHKIKIPRNANVIDCKGKFILPGLWDMHVHLGNATRSSLPLFIANGVTGVRDMGSKSFDSIQKWRKEVSSGLVAGPRIISPGPILNGGTHLPGFQLAVNTTEEAAIIVDSLARIGVDFIKVHGGLTREVYFTIAEESARHHLPFAGHVPASSTAVGVSGDEASAAGQHSLEHMLGIPFARDTIQAYQHMYPTEEGLKRLFAVLLKNKTYITPTLSVYYIPADYVAISEAQKPLLKYISPELVSFWNSQTGGWAKRDKPFMKWLLKARMNMIPALRDAGVPLLAGTDTGFPFVLPGFGLHKELEHLVAAGLTPFEALKAATINPAIYLNKHDRLGSVEKGKLADLIIVNADPTLKIQNLQMIESVIVNGKLCDRAALDHELLQVSRNVNPAR